MTTQPAYDTAAIARVRAAAQAGDWPEAIRRCYGVRDDAARIALHLEIDRQMWAARRARQVEVLEGA